MSFARAISAISFSILAAFSTFTIGCAETPQQKADKANSKIDRLNAIDRELASKGFPFYMGLRSAKAPEGLSDQEIANVRALLNEYITTGREVQNLTTDKDVMFFDTGKLAGNISQAQMYLDSISGYESRRRAKVTEQEQLANQIKFLTDLSDRLKVIDEKIVAKAKAIVQRDGYFTGPIDPTSPMAEAIRFDNAEFLRTAPLSSLITLKSDLIDMKAMCELQMAELDRSGASVGPIGKSALQKSRENVDRDLNSLKIQILRIETEVNTRTIGAPGTGTLRPSGGRKTPDLNS